jgi:3-hydroxyacyl-CoA dehydrogenase
LRDCDWIIEVVAENLEIKRALLAKVNQFRRADAIITTNTSGLPVSQIAEGMDAGFQKTLVRHTLLQSTALHAFAGSDSNARS